MYLHNDAGLFQQMATECALGLGTAEAYVVKDYFAVSLLKKAAQVNPLLVFKGGTCLSKCYRVIDRFSEDVDLGIQSAHATEGMRKGMKRAVVSAANALDLVIENLESTRSRREFNRFIIPIPAADGTESTDKLIAETAVMTPADPAQLRPLQSYIGEFCVQNGYDELVEEYDLGPFEVLANSMERTFCDKVYALCDYYLAGEIPHRQSRHVYDLRKLSRCISLDENLAALMRTVRAQRLRGYRCPSAEPEMDIPALLEHIAAKEAYRHDYEHVTAPLLYETMPYDEAASVFGDIAAFLRRQEV
ncbi:nucleotidyl transferase AbiEii/AbiGii toxin family protein [Adlercreutzia sp. R7]|uniref:Nucleotidyl transferase AbiEii/AbiGii toxin family protein n=1 Tax=Adlercreutzia wanghongyangiae TaxID=3111451 RepID=A0ABU6IIL9_9ACTN|nr:nucleotidyl transferase AbiEii/AbiGii toxin family protein [Adlercreutzia sp. R7]